MATDEVTVLEKDTETKVAMRPPGMYNVVLLNDDTTPMDLVIMILMQIFHKSREVATEITIRVHENGRGIAGTYSFEVANQKKTDTIQIANAAGYDLQCVVEESQ